MTSAWPPHLRTRDGLQLATHHWPVACDFRPELAQGRAPMGTCLLVHGLGEHGARYAELAQVLNGQGWSVLGLDHRGHGRSEGPRGRLQRDDDFLHDLALAIDVARASHPGQPLVLIGHSMGGAMVGQLVSASQGSGERPPWAREVDALVLSSPALAIPMRAWQRALLNSVGRLTPDLPVSNGLAAEWICHNPQTVQAYRQDPLVHDRISGRLTRWMLLAGEQVRARAAVWRTPTLIMWGQDDRCVDPAGSQEFARHASAQSVSSRPWPGLAHEIFNEQARAQVFAHLSEWLQAQFVRP